MEPWFLISDIFFEWLSTLCLVDLIYTVKLDLQNLNTLPPPKLSFDEIRFVVTVLLIISWDVNLEFRQMIAYV